MPDFPYLTDTPDNFKKGYKSCCRPLCPRNYVRHCEFPFGHHLMDINNGPSSSRKGYDVGFPSNMFCYRNEIFRVPARRKLYQPIL